MKKILALLITVTSLHSAQATSILNTKLEYERTNKSVGGVNHRLFVLSNGTVVHVTMTAQLIGGRSRQVVARLTGDQMDKIDQLIRRSQPVLRGFEASHIQCFAPSTFTEKFTARNETVFLKMGAECDGGFRINAQPAAKKLARVLSVLENAAHTRQATYLVEQQVDNILF